MRVHLSCMVTRCLWCSQPAGTNAIVVNHGEFTVINYAFRPISFSHRESACLRLFPLLNIRTLRFFFLSLSPSLTAVVLFSPCCSLNPVFFPLLSTNNRRTPRRFVVERSDPCTLAFHLCFLFSRVERARCYS